MRKKARKKKVSVLRTVLQLQTNRFESNECIWSQESHFCPAEMYVLICKKPVSSAQFCNPQTKRPGSNECIQTHKSHLFFFPQPLSHSTWDLPATVGVPLLWLQNLALIRNFTWNHSLLHTPHTPGHPSNLLLSSTCHSYLAFGLGASLALTRSKLGHPSFFQLFQCSSRCSTCWKLTTVYFSRKQ